MAFLKAGGERLSGTLGGRVYRDTGGGDVVVAAAPIRVNPKTPTQVAARLRLDQANALWAALPLDSMARWRRAAESVGDPHPVLPQRGGSRTRRTSGVGLFRSLATKYLAVHGGSTVPTEPPATSFLGDGITVVATGNPRPSGRGGSGIEDVAERGGTPSLLSNWETIPEDSFRSGVSSPPSSYPPKGEEPGLVFSSDFPNTPGVVTELLVQRLPSRIRLPKARDYRTARYVALAGEPVLVPARPGAYACGFRFVRAATGQATTMVALGMVEVD